MQVQDCNTVFAVQPVPKAAHQPRQQGVPSADSATPEPVMTHQLSAIQVNAAAYFAAEHSLWVMYLCQSCANMY